MMKTASDMREQSRNLMLYAECCDTMQGLVKTIIFNKL